jgi:hypothetical protein
MKKMMKKSKGMARGGRMKSKGMAKGGKMKSKGYAKGGKTMMKKSKGMARGGKTKGGAKGGAMTLASIRSAAKAKGYKLVKA